MRLLKVPFAVPAVWVSRRTRMPGVAVVAAAAALLAVVGSPAVAVAVPSLGPGATLGAIGCASPTACWAVGSYGNDQGATVNEALGWDGMKWSLAATPDPGGAASSFAENELFGVACASAGECFAVGVYLRGIGASAFSLNEALLWNGREWSSVAAPNPGRRSGNRLSGVACASANECFAVGDYFNSRGADFNEVLRWNGRRWAVSATPDPGGTAGHASNSLSGVACVSVRACFAVGNYRNSKGAVVNEVLRWNGRKWSISITPSPGAATAGHVFNSFLSGIACSSVRACFAVGEYRNNNGAVVNEALRWNGRKWSLSTTPDPGGRTAGHASNSLSGVACVSARDCFAVGKYFTRARFLDEALHWNGTRWSISATPHPGGRSGSELAGVACSSASSCFAVGDYSKGNEILNSNGTTWTAA